MACTLLVNVDVDNTNTTTYALQFGWSLSLCVLVCACAVPFSFTSFAIPFDFGHSLTLLCAHHARRRTYVVVMYCSLVVWRLTDSKLTAFAFTDSTTLIRRCSRSRSVFLFMFICVCACMCVVTIQCVVYDDF